MEKEAFVCLIPDTTQLHAMLIVFKGRNTFWQKEKKSFCHFNTEEIDEGYVMYRTEGVLKLNLNTGMIGSMYAVL